MLRILGVDIDGVITDEGLGDQNIWHQEMSNWFGKIEKVCDAYEFDLAYGLSSEAVEEFFKARAESIFSSVIIRKGCRETLRAVQRAGIRIVLITARNKEFQSVTAQWLQKNKVPHDELIFDGNKAESARKAGVELFIDDYIKNCDNLLQAGIPALCFTMEHNENRKTKAPRVENWAQIAEHLSSFFGEALGGKSLAG